MSGAGGEHDIEERTWVFFFSYALALSFQGLELLSGHAKGQQKPVCILCVLAQGSSPGDCEKKEVYPVGQGLPCIRGLPALEPSPLGIAWQVQAPGTAMPQTAPKVSHARYGDTGSPWRDEDGISFFKWPHACWLSKMPT